MAEQKPGALDQALSEDLKTTKKQQGGVNQRYSGDKGPTKGGYDRSEVVSALQKMIRRGREPEAIYWCMELLRSDEGYRMWRRLMVIAAEDVGLAAPDMCHKIWCMYQAHNMAKENNIPVLAVMMLCRAPKNREADDAAELYRIKMDQGWKIPMPPEAVDGHTRRGRGNLYRRADQTGTHWEKLWNEEFWYEAGLLDKYQEVETDGVSEFYRRELMKLFGMAFNTMDLHTSTKPRPLAGRTGTRAPLSTLAARIPAGGGQIEPKASTDSGEVTPDIYRVQSFTTQGVEYEVDMVAQSCTCPAWTNSDGGLCKHQLAVQNWITEERKRQIKDGM